MGLGIGFLGLFVPNTFSMFVRFWYMAGGIMVWIKDILLQISEGQIDFWLARGVELSLALKMNQPFQRFPRSMET